MTSRRFQRWVEAGRLRRHRTTPREIGDLLAVAARDLADAHVSATSIDRRFATAYSAALQLATVVLAASGYRVSAQRGHHAVTIQALPELLGPGATPLADFLDSCRTLRNTSDYDRVGAVTERDLAELLDEVERFRRQALDWLTSAHPKLLSK